MHSLPGSLDSDVHPITLSWMSACPAANEQAPVALVSMQKHTEELLTYLEVLAEEASAQRLHGTGGQSSRSSTRRTSSDEKRGDRIPRADHPRHFQATEGITRRGHRMKEERTWLIGCSVRMSTPTGRIQRQRCGSTTTARQANGVAASATDIGQATSWPKEIVHSEKDATKAGVKLLTIAQWHPPGT